MVKAAIASSLHNWQLCAALQSSERCNEAGSDRRCRKCTHTHTPGGTGRQMHLHVTMVTHPSLGQSWVLYNSKCFTQSTSIAQTHMLLLYMQTHKKDAHMQYLHSLCKTVIHLQHNCVSHVTITTISLLYRHRKVWVQSKIPILIYTVFKGSLTEMFVFNMKSKYQLIYIWL